MMRHKAEAFHALVEHTSDLLRRLMEEAADTRTEEEKAAQLINGLRGFPETDEQLEVAFE